jgi:hypothetical protein
VQKLKNEEFNRIIILDNEIKKINGLKIMGSSGYFILSTFE